MSGQVIASDIPQGGQWVEFEVKGQHRYIFWPAFLRTPNYQEIPDLLVIPQFGIHQPAEHLDPEQMEHVQEDWARFGRGKGTPDGAWTVAIAHSKENGLHITAVVDVPRFR